MVACRGDPAPGRSPRRVGSDAAPGTYACGPGTRGARLTDHIPPIAPIAQGPGLNELITQRLLGLIGSGQVHEGHKLPTERVLADALGVSRTMVREALSGLQLAGIVERRPGFGTVITRVPRSAVDLQGYLTAGTSITQVIEARFALELGVVHLLCEPRSYALAEVTGLLDTMRVGIREERDAEAYVRPSLEFHCALARATERPMVAQCQEGLIQAMEPHLWLLIERYSLDLAERSLALHERMLHAVEAKDLIAALAEVKAHYRPYPAMTISSVARASA